MPTRQNVKRESRNIGGRFRGGKLAPVMAVAYKQGEGGLLSQSAVIELDPIAGRLITPITAQMFSVFVPLQACDALKNSASATAGITEVMRQTLESGAPLFVLEDENELSKRMGVMPCSIGGVLKVNEIARLAHNAAVNFLRRRIYTYAAQVAATNVAVTPALLSRTVLDMFGAVLNPDDHINGQVSFDMQQQTVPIKGVGWDSTPPSAGNAITIRETGGVERAATGFGTTSQDFIMEQDPANVGYPNVRAELDGVVGQMSLADLANAQTMDRLTRTMRAIIDRNPVDGEQQVLRWAYGMSVDTDKNPYMIAMRETIFGQEYKTAMDKAGMDAETAQSRNMVRMEFTVPVPKTELGGVVVTFLAVKPDETLYQQPHPVLSEPWAQENLVAEELELDPVPVTARQVQADVDIADEATVVFYTGYNGLKRTYVNYGFNRQLDPTTVEAKNAIWQYEIPASVTPENIVYPADIPHDPFLDTLAEIASYMVRSEAVIATPIVFGPTPVEEVAIIETDDIFEDEVTA